MKRMSLSFLLLAATACSDTASREIMGGANSTINIKKNETINIPMNETISVDGSVIEVWSAAKKVSLTNNGTLISTRPNGRAIYETGDLDTQRDMSIKNNSFGVIRSGNDAIRIESDLTKGRILIRNDGLIETTRNGQAIDLEAVKGTGTDNASLVIENGQAGRILSIGSDSIRPGQGALIQNAGLIKSDGPLGQKNDAVDFKNHSGVVKNLPGGEISGQRHGITSDTHIDILNEKGATILGRNGSGVGSDGDGRVVNYGHIIGDYVGTGDGDGDGIDIDNNGYVENYGLIEARGFGGVDKNGGLTSSEGIAFTGGGTIINYPGGIIKSVNIAVVMISPRQKPSRLENSGQIRGEFVGIMTHGMDENTIINSGEIIAQGTAIRMRGLKNTLILEKGSSIEGGVFATKEGDNQIILRDGVTFNSASGFDKLIVEGDVSILGESRFESIEITDGSIVRIGDGGELGGLSGNITNNGTIIIRRKNDYKLPGQISGQGKIVYQDAM